MYSLFIKLNQRLEPETWDLISGIFYQFHSIGVREAEEPPPTGEAALHTGDEFLEAIQPVFLPPEEFEAYFRNKGDAEKALRATLPFIEKILLDHKISLVEEKDYSESWKENFKPIEATPFYVRASWHEKSKNPNDIDLLIEPGMAFGTGSHETTRSCLELIAKSYALLQKKKQKPEWFLDFGCGSGILAIALKKLGAKNVCAVDIDPLSIQASEINAKNNGVELRVGYHYPSEVYFDLIVANILKNTLLEFSEKFQQRLKPGGLLILSGLLVEQGDEILKKFQSVGFKKIESIEKKEWVSFLLQREEHSQS